MTQPAQTTTLNQPGPACRPATPAERERALSLLLTGSETADGQAVAQFLAAARDQHIDLNHLWIALRPNNVLSASLLLVPAAGRTAMLFLSPTTAPAVDDAAALVRACTATQDRRSIRLVQALLDSWQQHEVHAFADAGFTKLANLLYLQRPIEPLPPTREPEALGDLHREFDVSQWGLTTRGRFEKTILASYEHTSDCPTLVGLRTIDDILASHRVSGTFTPEWWFSLWKNGDPVGVMLINLAQQRAAAELVYLGLAPQWRGKGLGRRLMNRAIELAARRACTSMMTAVDEANPPAMALYQSLHFAPHTRKLAMINALT